MSRKRGRVELSEYASMARRILRGWARRFSSEGDEQELMQLLDLRYELDVAIRRAIIEIRGRGEDVSWTTIGDMAGISRQAARQKWDLEARAKQREYERAHRARISKAPFLAA